MTEAFQMQGLALDSVCGAVTGVSVLTVTGKKAASAAVMGLRGTPISIG